MSPLAATIVYALVGLLDGSVRHALPTGAAAMVTIEPGTYTPLFPPSPEEERIPVARFSIDRTPVQNWQFLAFVFTHPQYRRDRIQRVSADAGYLAHWAGPTTLGPAAPARAPVTRVSWFAAKAYCEARGARLPTEAEWEYVASASETASDGRKDPAWNARILAWYGKPGNQALPAVGQSAANFYGVKDLHGLAWEWVLDFNSALVGSDARADADGDKMKFCGASALLAKNKADYGTFMRLAMRSSLSAAYTTNSLSFRCARGVGAEP